MAWSIAFLKELKKHFARGFREMLLIGNDMSSPISRFGAAEQSLPVGGIFHSHLTNVLPASILLL